MSELSLNPLQNDILHESMKQNDGLRSTKRNPRSGENNLYLLRSLQMERGTAETCF